MSRPNDKDDSGLKLSHSEEEAVLKLFAKLEDNGDLQTAGAHGPPAFRFAERALVSQLRRSNDDSSDSATSAIYCGLITFRSVVGSMRQREQPTQKAPMADHGKSA